MSTPKRAPYHAGTLPPPPAENGAPRYIQSMLPGTGVYGFPSVWVDACTECGLLVHSRVVHDEWHRVNPPAVGDTNG